MKRHAVIVKMFDRELQEQIETENHAFLNQAVERKQKAEQDEFIKPIEKPIVSTSFEKLSVEALQKFISLAKLPYKIEQTKFKEYLADIGVMSFDKTDNLKKKVALFQLFVRPL